MKVLYSIVAALATAMPAVAQNAALDARIAQLAQQEESKVVAWRRDIHQHPELGNTETRTAVLIAEHLKSLGLEVQTGVARTGVVALLKGGKPGPVVALRADMDGLPLTEPAGLAFASTVKTQYNGQPAGVMHACGHDAHVAMLLGAADVLSQVKKRPARHGEVYFSACRRRLFARRGRRRPAYGQAGRARQPQGGRDLWPAH